MRARYLQVVETYDSFRPDFLLAVDFRLVDVGQPRKINTFRSAYLSIRQIYDGQLTLMYQQELKLDQAPILKQNEPIPDRIDINGLMLPNPEAILEEQRKRVQLEEEGMYFGPGVRKVPWYEREM